MRKSVAGNLSKLPVEDPETGDVLAVIETRGEAETSMRLTYHCIVYGGALAPDFYRVASRFLLAATVFLALGLSADIHVVVSKIAESDALANIFSIATAVTLLGLWHAWPWWRRAKKVTSSSSGKGRW